MREPQTGWRAAIKITVIVCCTVALVAALFSWTMCVTSRDMTDVMRKGRELTLDQLGGASGRSKRAVSSDKAFPFHGRALLVRARSASRAR